MKIISIGSNCNPRSFIKKYYRMESYPFDYLITNIDFVINTFETSNFDFCSIKNLYFDYKECKHHQNLHIKNKETDYTALSIHDIKINEDLSKVIPVVDEKYKRRFKRLYDILNSEEEVLLIREILDKQDSVIQINDTIEKLDYLYNLVQKKFNKSVTMCVIETLGAKATIFNDLKSNNKNLNIKLFKTYDELKYYIDSKLL